MGPVSPGPCFYADDSIGAFILQVRFLTSAQPFGGPTIMEVG